MTENKDRNVQRKLFTVEREVTLETPALITPLHISMAREHVSMGSTTPRMELWYLAEGTARELVINPKRSKFGLQLTIVKTGETFQTSLWGTLPEYFTSVQSGREVYHIFSQYVIIEPPEKEN